MTHDYMRQLANAATPSYVEDLRAMVHGLRSCVHQLLDEAEVTPDMSDATLTGLAALAQIEAIEVAARQIAGLQSWSPWECRYPQMLEAEIKRRLPEVPENKEIK